MPACTGTGAHILRTSGKRGARRKAVYPDKLARWLVHAPIEGLRRLAMLDDIGRAMELDSNRAAAVSRLQRAEHCGGAHFSAAEKRLPPLARNADEDRRAGVDVCGPVKSQHRAVRAEIAGVAWNVAIGIGDVDLARPVDGPARLVASLAGRLGFELDVLHGMNRSMRGGRMAGS